MAVSADVALPAQPATGSQSIVPYGGDGAYAPLAEYLVDTRVAHDASGGNATLTITMDRRYTNALTFCVAIVSGAAAASEYLLQLARSATSNEAAISIVGTMPFVAASFATSSTQFLWYPPPMFYQTEGQLSMIVPNVDGDTSILRAQIYCFNDRVRQTTPLPYLLQNFPGAGGSTPV